MNYLINCINLQKNYLKKRALININLKFQEGKIYGLLGPNGSGKTTLMKVIADLHKQTGGEITICVIKAILLTFSQSFCNSPSSLSPNEARLELS